MTSKIISFWNPVYRANINVHDIVLHVMDASAHGTKHKEIASPATAKTHSSTKVKVCLLFCDKLWWSNDEGSLCVKCLNYIPYFTLRRQQTWVLSFGADCVISKCGFYVIFFLLWTDSYESIFHNFSTVIVNSINLILNFKTDMFCPAHNVISEQYTFRRKLFITIPNLVNETIQLFP